MTMRMMPPTTPTTTPMIIFFVCVDIPDDELPDWDDKLAVGDTVDAVVCVVTTPFELVVVTTSVTITVC